MASLTYRHAKSPGSSSSRELKLTRRNTESWTGVKSAWTGWLARQATTTSQLSPNWHLSSGSEGKFSTFKWSSAMLSHMVVNDVALFSPSYRPWWFLLKNKPNILKPLLRSINISEAVFWKLLTGYLVFPQYQWCQPQSPQGASAAPSPPDLQRCLCQTEQGHHQHAPNCRALHCLGVRKAVFWVENVKIVNVHGVFIAVLMFKVCYCLKS